MRYLKMLAFIVFFVMSMIFFVQNSGPGSLGTAVQVKLDLILVKWISVPLPFYLLCLFCLLAGSVLTLLYFFTDKIKTTKQLRNRRTEIKGLEKELGSLRNMPLSEEHQDSLG